MKAQALRIEVVPIASLKLDPRNARVHGARNLQAIRDSLQQFGQAKPIVVSLDNVVIAGNGTLTAAAALGWAVVQIVRVDLDEKERAAFAIADNRTAELAEWDPDVLAETWRGLDEDLRMASGVMQEDLDAMARDSAARDGGAAPAKIERAAELAEEWGTARGQCWMVGRHRLLCGDATSAEDRARLLGSGRPRILVTDPPYGVSYDPEWRVAAGLNENTHRHETVNHDDVADWSAAFDGLPCDVAYVWHSDIHAGVAARALDRNKYEIRAQIIWVKPSLVISRGHYHWRHEPCWYAVRKGGGAKWVGDQKQSTVWELPGDRGIDGGHATPKPVEIMRRPMRNHSGDVLDLFLGSGSTLIAAEMHGRTCWGMEIDPKFVAVSLQRAKDQGIQDICLAQD